MKRLRYLGVAGLVPILLLASCSGGDDDDSSGGSGAGAGGVGGTPSNTPLLCSPVASTSAVECNTSTDSIQLPVPVGPGDTIAFSLKVQSRNSLGLEVYGENSACGAFSDATELGRHTFTADGEYCVEFPVTASFSHVRYTMSFSGQYPEIHGICSGGCQ